MTRRDGAHADTASKPAITRNGDIERILATPCKTFYSNDSAGHDIFCKQAGFSPAQFTGLLERPLIASVDDKPMFGREFHP
jgi:hypothetical protein